MVSFREAATALSRTAAPGGSARPYSPRSSTAWRG
jgi:hypothetical protein